MITRHKAVRRMGCGGACLAMMQIGVNAFATARDDSTPPLAPRVPMSTERMALIEAFTKQSEGLEDKFEAHSLKPDWVMPYRLFRPEASGKLPLVDGERFVSGYGFGHIAMRAEKSMGFGL